MAGSLARRLAVAAIAIPVAIGVVYAGDWWLASTLALLGVLGAREVYALAARRGATAFAGVGSVGAAAFPLLVNLYVGPAALPPDAWLALTPMLWLLVALGAATLRAPGNGPLVGLGVTVLGAVYCGALPAALLFLRHPTTPVSPLAGTSLALLPLVTTWICDTCAMAGGAALGGPKLAPTISPAKTWSGAVAGALGALAAAPVWGVLVVRPAGANLSLGQLLACGALVGTAGQLGDLAESVLKRDAGVKDSGSLFPGHGGVLDRLDSLYWSVPGTAAIVALGRTL
ncbi:MAG TPA: phosphatidate cytidylyltransferase [Gemmatimonadales bacterium]|nr:phosphatidate cytidylyltransferase [Gemmatimonadales bacterium]